MKDARRSIVASFDLKKGIILTEEMVECKRPGNGIQPGYIHMLIGRKLKRDIKQDELIMWEDI
jgi:N-acetylneuraminate synthase/N,N'-diacetyllegionaminate synthase